MARCESCMTNPVHPDKKCCFNCARVNTNCEVWHNCGEDCPGWDSKVKTNADRIRAMSDEELVKFIEDTQIAGCPDPARSCRASCKDCIMDWLQQPVEVE